MTPEQEKAVEQVNLILAKEGLVITEVSAIDENGNKIGTPKKPRK